MKKYERLEIFKANLIKIVEREKGGFVVFEASPEKFVQFGGDKEFGLVCDIPLAELSKEEEKRLLTLKEFSKAEGSRDANSNDLIAYQTFYNEEEVNQAAGLTERIFVEVFGFPNTYNVVTKLNLNK